MNNALHKGVLFMFGGGEEEGTLLNMKTHPYECAVIFGSISGLSLLMWGRVVLVGMWRHGVGTGWD